MNSFRFSALKPLLLVILCACVNAARGDFSNTVQSFHPIAYWPLNETNQPPLQSATETNLGTLGATGNGTHSGLVLSIPGALPGDSNTADDLSSASVRIRFSQALKLTAPFSVEGWFNPENTTLNAAISCGELGSTRSGWLIYDDGTGWNFRMYDTNGGNATINISGGDVTVGMWHHVVATWDGTTATVYENGIMATSGTVTDLPFVPNTDGDLTIGMRSDGAFKWPGLADEVAIYTNLLSPADVAAHYQSGTNASPVTPYKSLILAQHPLVYFRMEGGVILPGGIASLPVATNYGSLGPLVNGIYYPGTQPGQAGPVGGGFGANNYSCHFVPSVGTAVECGTNSELDIGLNPMTVVCWFKGGPTDYGNRFQSILGRSDASWRADMDAAGIVRFVDGSPDCFGSTYANDNVWHFYSGVFDGAQEYVYLDGVLDATLLNIAHSDPTADMRIGGVGDYGDRMFNGSVAQVALFTNALSQADLLTLYSAAALPISILRQPAAISTYAGLSANMSVYAVGPTSYKWQKDGTDIPGQTSNTLVLTSLSVSDIGDYRAVLSNSLGTTNSQAAHLNVLSSPPAALNLSTALVLHLKFNNDSFDYSGRGNHGTLVGAPTYVAGGIEGIIIEL